MAVTCRLAAAGLGVVAVPLSAQEIGTPSSMQVQRRSAENAVTQAEDAFGLSVGRETLGLYSSDNVRGFSPINAGNARIDGLYFDQFLRPITRIRQSTTVRVGLAAQGFIFPAPTGVIDYALRKPGDRPVLSVLVSGDSFGTATIEADGQLPLVGDTLSIGAGVFAGTTSYYNGTRNHAHNEGIELRWRPNAAIEVMPFWTRSFIRDTTGAIYVPADASLPPPIPRRRFDGPNWAAYRGVAGVYGTTARFDIGDNSAIRVGLFRSYYSDHVSSANLLLGLRQDGSFDDRLIIVDPPSRYVSDSGELRLTRRFGDGERTHLVHLTLRGRDRREGYDGSDYIDLGPGRVGDRITVPQPSFAFTTQSHDRVRQWTMGAAYQLQWTRLGQLGLGVQRTDYRKQVDRPDTVIGDDRQRPFLFYASGTAYLTSALWLYGSFTQGLEESGSAPDQAVNRNQPVPAIRTRQIDGGVRWAIRRDLKLIAGVFDLRKPYYSLDAASRFVQLGGLRNQGVEISLSGALTPRLNVVAGAVLLRPRVTGEAVAIGRVGDRPIGFPASNVTLNADWRLPWFTGVSIDGDVTRRSRVFATTNNQVTIPARVLLDFGGRYRFQLAGRDTTLRLSITNLTNRRGFDLRGAGAYDIIPGRLASAYITVDL